MGPNATHGRLCLAVLTLVMTIPARSAGQEPPVPATLSLPEAIDLARRNNPDYRATANDEWVADWRKREAYGQFIPTLGRCR